MKIAIGCDPNAADLKKEIIEYVSSLGYEVTDFGSDDPIYAHVAIQVAESVVNGTYDRGILMCGTGIGMMLAANKVNGAYAANVTNVYCAERACLSNNCNIITLGSKVVDVEMAKKIVQTYLSLQYEYNERSGPKVDAILNYEKSHFATSYENDANNEIYHSLSK